VCETIALTVGLGEDVLGAPVVLRSYGPTAAAKRGLQAAPVLPRLLPGRSRPMAGWLRHAGRGGYRGGSSISRLTASAMARYPASLGCR
jgi:hypothetical protein